MKVVISCQNQFKVAGDVQRFLVDGEKITFEFRTRANLTFLKEYFDEHRFSNIQNILKSVNVSSTAIGIIDFPSGQVRLDSTDDGKALYDSVLGVGKTSSGRASTPTTPLIDGKYTQAPQGAVSKVSKEVLDNIGKNVNNTVDSQSRARI